MEGYQYHRYQPGAQSFWIPLGFPAQYFDAETDLFENRNRYYDSSTGRYLQAEPLLQRSGYVREMAMDGRSVPAYAYALNNPLGNIDANGLEVRVTGGFSGYHVNDPTCRRSPGNTCFSSSFYIGTCYKNDCSWKFDINVNYDVKIEFQEGVDPSRPDQSRQQSLWEHENQHLKEITEAMNHAILNGLIRTEGFDSKGACEAARRSAKPRLEEYLKSVTKKPGH